MDWSAHGGRVVRRGGPANRRDTPGASRRLENPAQPVLRLSAAAAPAAAALAASAAAGGVIAMIQHDTSMKSETVFHANGYT